MKRIAILTSGGDAPGMNASIRASVRYAICNDIRVYGINRGYKGLLENDFFELHTRSVSDIIQRGGTILRSARSLDFETEEGQNLAVKFLNLRGIDGLIVIGGDGSIRGLNALTKKGIKGVGIPGTIDNDLGYTDYTLGFDTAVNTVLDAINKLRDTMGSHERISIIEVMGRNCGDIALLSGLGGGAEIILVPEIKVGFNDILSMLKECIDGGKKESIIVIAEGAGSGEDLRNRISKRFGSIVRSTVLGHLQRGGSPSNRDRFLGTLWGIEAVKILKNGATSRILGIKNDKIFDMDIAEGINIKKEFNYNLYNMASIVSNSTSNEPCS